MDAMIMRASAQSGDANLYTDKKDKYILLTKSAGEYVETGRPAWSAAKRYSKKGGNKRTSTAAFSPGPNAATSTSSAPTIHPETMPRPAWLSSSSDPLHILQRLTLATTMPQASLSQQTPFTNAQQSARRRASNPPM